MTKGKIVNKQTGLEIPGTRTEAGNKMYFWFSIDGDETPKLWYHSIYEFIEDKPSTYEQYLALKPGARFTLSGKGGRVDIPRIKLDDDTYAFKWNSGDWGTNVSSNFKVKSLTIEEVTD